jgi:predicted unusual protein kinase regulating ubiquinone biosynthesis (AarF/ABC1/UbiB family)
MKYFSQFNDTAPFKTSDVYNVKEIVDNLNRVCNTNINVKHSTPERSGMVALVYYGTMDDNDVVVKVKRRNIEDNLEDALKKMRFIVKIASYMPWLNRLYLPTIFEENRQDMLNQLDFSNEVRNLSLYKKSFRHMDFVRIPLVYEHFTNEDDRVIVMERLYGTRLHDIKSDKEKAEYGPLLAKFSMKSILYDRRYHADLHAGNIFFMGNPGDRKIGIIDFGIIGCMSKEAQDNFYNFFKSILVDNDYIEGTNVLLSRLVEPKQVYINMTPRKKHRLLAKMAIVTKDVFGPDSILDARTVYRINNELMEYGLYLSRPFCRIQLSLAVCASVCNELCRVGDNYMHHVSNVTKNMIAEREIYEM